MHDDSTPLALPDSPPEAAPTPFPLISAVAPLVAAGILWAITQSPFVLVFAVLSPIIAVASVGDRKLQSRRARRRAERERRAAVEKLSVAVEEAHRLERAQLEADFPQAIAHAAVDRGGFRWRPVQSSATTVVVGRASIPSVRPLRGSPLTAAEAELRDRAATLEAAPLTVDLASGFGIVAPRGLAEAVARTALCSLALRLAPGRAVISATPRTDGWGWASDLPHRLSTSTEGTVTVAVHEAGQPPVQADAVISVAAQASLLPPHIATVLEYEAGGVWRLTALDDDRRVADCSPELLSEAEASRIATMLEAAADQLGLCRDERLPRHVRLDELARTGDVDGLSTAIGRFEDGDALVDLVMDGPHAVVGGTTGSGKSELLITWVCSLARERSSDEITFLLVDFKGGATFQPLVDLPHCVGVVTDLDEPTAQRAVESLRAELSRRERVLADNEVANIADLPAGTLPRLVIVVDEFASMIATFSDFHDLFADIAARGRSLGIHLILCTQRPVGVVRESLLANCPLRMSLRVTSAGDSQAVLGVDDAAALPADAPGRCIVSHGGRSRQLQVATTTAEEIRRIALSAPDAAEPQRPWLDPLAPCIELSSLETQTATITLGVADLPAQQRQDTVFYDPVRTGSLLAVGAHLSGKTALVDLVAAQWPRVRLIGRHPEQAWDALSDLYEQSVAASPQTTPLLAVIDDLDAIVAALPERRQPVVMEWLMAILREGPAQSIFVVATAARITSTLRSLTSLFGGRLVLRVSDRHEHLLLDAPSALWNPAAVPGSAVFGGHRMQLALSAQSATAAEHAPESLSFADGSLSMLVTRRPSRRRRELAAWSQALRLHQIEPGGFPVDGAVGAGTARAGTVVIADPDTWHGQHRFLAEHREDAVMLFDGCLESDIRALARGAESPPLTFGPQRVLALRPDGSWERLVWPPTREPEEQIDRRAGDTMGGS